MQIGAGLFLLTLLLAQGSPGLASPVARPPGQDETPPPAWQEAIERIDQALAAGKISQAQAVRLRLQALQDPFALPEAWRPRYAPQAYARPPARCGLPEAMAKTWALFRDHDQWDEGTKVFIEQAIQRFEQEHRARLEEAETLETEHFRVRWNPDEIPDGQAYARVLADYLEEAWTRFANAGYTMPDPSEYYTVIPTDPPTIFYYDRIEVEIVQDVRICGLFPVNAQAVTLPITMQFDVDYLSTTRSASEQATAAHELFHVIQWDYLGFRQVQCPLIDPGPAIFYMSPANRGAWLMEGSSTWVEKSLYGQAFDDKIEQDHFHPEWSLFVFDRFRGDTNREYGTALFLWYLNNFYGGRYQQPIVKRIWEQLHKDVPPLQKDTVDAVTEVLLHPDQGSSPYSDYPELWQSLFADFILADYLKGAYPPLAGQPGGDWGTWNPNVDLVTVLKDIKKPECLSRTPSVFPR